MNDSTKGLIYDIRTYVAAPRGWAESGLPGLLSILDQYEIGHISLVDDVQPELRERYPEVERFADQMRAELAANSHKGNQESWRRMSPKEAWVEISWHLGKLTAALKAEDAAMMHELATDIANGAMMFDDILNRIEENMRRARSGRTPL